MQLTQLIDRTMRYLHVPDDNRALVFPPSLRLGKKYGGRFQWTRPGPPRRLADPETPISQRSHAVPNGSRRTPDEVLATRLSARDSLPSSERSREIWNDASSTRRSAATRSDNVRHRGFKFENRNVDAREAANFSVMIVWRVRSSSLEIVYAQFVECI